MKKLLFVVCACIMMLAASSQNSEKRWSVGIHGGRNQYAGDLGSGFYRFDRAFYGHAGFSVSRYLTRHFDASLFFTRGEMGYQKEGISDPVLPNGFLVRLTTANLLLRYNFFRPEARVRPYVAGGLAMMFQQGIAESYVKRNSYDFALPSVAAGINFRITSWLGIQLQELFMHTTADDVDFRIGGINDLYLFHSLGVTFNFGDFGRMRGEEMTGVGERIDKCPDKLRQPRNKESRREARKTKKGKKHNGNGNGH
jgi:OmpA-OmpF porin, OOP family